MAALYASEEAKSMEIELTGKSVDEIKQAIADGKVTPETVKAAGEKMGYMGGDMYMAYLVPEGATSFVQVDEFHAAHDASERVGELTRQFQALAANVISSGEVGDKEMALDHLVGEFSARLDEAMRMKVNFVKQVADTVTGLFKQKTKTEDGVNYPAKDFAYAPDPEKPSTWKLRLSEGRPGNITVSQLGRAAAALSSGGFRGQRVQLPSDAVAAVKARIRREYRNMNVEPEDIPDAVKERQFLTWKDTSGRTRWEAIFSNKYRDRDQPPEILSERAHKGFVDRADAGYVDMPELWLWHTPGTRWGQADWLAYDDSTGFALASGLVDEGKEHIAKALEEMDLLVSHGMPIESIERDPADNTVIIRYDSKEISPLPSWAAANALTEFATLSKEQTEMAIPTEKREFLLQAGLAEEDVKAIEDRLESKAKDAAGLEYKDTETAETPATEPVAGTPAPAETAPLTREEVAEAITAVVKPLVDQVQALMGEVKSLQTSDDQRIAEKAAATPPASLAALLAREFRSIGAREAEVKAGDPLLRGPRQTEAQDAASTGNPIMDSVIGPLLAGNGKK
jgi:hypothetical protein